MASLNIKTVSSNLLALVLVLAAVAWLSNRWFFRLDFTADKRYTLSEATKDIIGNLQGNVSIRAFFTKDLPPDIARVRQDFREMLVEYYQLSNGKIVFDIIDPSDKPLDEQEAVNSGIQPAVVNVREKDQVKQQKVYLGAVIRMGNESEVIPLIQPGAAMEYALSSAIKKVSVINKPVIGFLQGQGEPGLAEMQQLVESMSVLYKLEPVNLPDSIYTLGRYPTLMLVAPTDSFSPAKLGQLDRYLREGGRLFMALNGVQGDFQSMQGNVLENGLREWLKKKGLQLGSQFLVDAQCANIGVTQQSGGFTFQSQIPFPYFPMINQFTDHPITRGLESVVLQFPVSITVAPGTAGQAEVLATTSPQTGQLDPPIFFSIDRQWTQADFKAGAQPVAVVLNMKGDTEGKLVLVSSGDFATNGSGQQAQQVQPDNVSLMSNAIDWLSDQSGLMELRTKQVTSRPLDAVTDSHKAFLKYLNFLLPLILVLGYGLYRMQKNKRIRTRRMNYGMI
ncbi:MAG TPA: Gldg family protein [Bacteroidales bacterium]|nr:Gldg family protein [Bacteroidales bacterium]HSA44403.1 Gldg family protein [Bacteroidales bacterium]